MNTKSSKQSKMASESENSPEQEVPKRQKRKRNGIVRNNSSTSEDGYIKKVFVRKRRREGSTRSKDGATSLAEEGQEGTDDGACLPSLRQGSTDKPLAELKFVFSLPIPEPTSFFQLPQGHRMKLTVSYSKPKYIFSVAAQLQKYQEERLHWPLRETFVLLLHQTKDTQGKLMEGDSCPEAGKRCCFLEVHEDEIQKMGYITKNNMLHVILKHKPS